MSSTNLINSTNDKLYVMTADGLKATVTLGPTKCECALLNRIEGSINFRTQIDIAAGGTLYRVDGGRGIDDLTFTVLEGPFPCDSKPASVLEAMALDKPSLESRKIQLITEVSGRKQRTFNGHIIGCTYNTLNQDGFIATLVTVAAKGIWS